MELQRPSSRVSFGLFEADLGSGELWKAGYRVKLQSQPFRLLAILLERPGELFTREELRVRIWGEDTTVDFDHSLGIALNKIREALGDSADNPRFIQTIARRGYRFIAPVHRKAGPEGVPHATASKPSVILPEQTPSPYADAHPPVFPVPSDNTRATARGNYRWQELLTAAALLVLLTLAAYVFGSRRRVTAPPHIVRLTTAGHFKPSPENMESLEAGATDGVHLFEPLLVNGHAGLAGINLADGTQSELHLPSEIASPTLADISPDGGSLLVREHLSPESEQPLWIVPTIGGSARRVGTILAHDAAWMPDGQSILYASGNDLYVTGLAGTYSKIYAELPGRAYWLRWQPAGKLLRFTLLDPVAHTSTLWQLRSSDRKAVQILARFTRPAAECCGTWTATGDAYVFQASHDGSTDLWKLSGDSISDPVRLTDGPLQFESPVAARTGDRIFFLGVDVRSELERVTGTGDLRPERGFLDGAERVEYSPDGQWVSWRNDAGQLWRAKADGTDQVQLTSSGLYVFLSAWSPNANRLALMAREPGKAWRIYLVDANGAHLHPLLNDMHNAADPTWSPDGKTLMFGRVDDLMGKETGVRTLSVLDLASGQITAVPGSENLFSPRWSPDGRYVVALTLDQRGVRLLNVATGVWTTLPVPSGADPVWSSDSHSLYLLASLEPGQPIDRVSIPDGSVHQVIRLADAESNNAVDYSFVGLGPGNAVLVRARVFTGNMYSLNLK